MPRAAFQTAMRAACVALLTAYASDAMVKLQIYPGRPRTIYPPTGFVDTINDELDYAGLRRRTTTAEVIVIHGLYDSAEAAVQKDAFMDSFIDWATDHHDAAGPGTLVEVRRTNDLPDFVPDWMPPEQQATYYATRIELEGISLDAN